jgi:hypothetical protein
MSLLADDLDDFSLSCDDESGDDLPLPLHFGAFGGSFAGGGVLSPALHHHAGVEGFAAAFLPPGGAAAPPPAGAGGGRRRRRAADGDAPGRSRGNYSCSRCGQPKRGHGALLAPKGRCPLRRDTRGLGARDQHRGRVLHGCARAAAAAAAAVAAGAHCRR